jgi:hypothetical protein
MALPADSMLRFRFTLETQKAASITADLQKVLHLLCVIEAARVSLKAC